MPLFLIRETEVSNLSTVAPVSVLEIEIDAPDLRNAAQSVMWRRKGQLPDGMKFRHPTHRAYTNPPEYIEPSLTKYAGVADIVASDPSTLPKPSIDMFMDAAQVAIDTNMRDRHLEDDGDVGTAVYHLMDSLVDYASSFENDFGEILRQVIEDRWEMYEIPFPDITKFDFIPSSDADKAAAGRSAVDVHSHVTGVQDGNTPAVGIYHLMLSVMALCDQKQVRFSECVEQLREDSMGMAPGFRNGC